MYFSIPAASSEAGRHNSNVQQGVQCASKKRLLRQPACQQWLQRLKKTIREPVDGQPERILLIRVFTRWGSSVALIDGAPGL